MSKNKNRLGYSAQLSRHNHDLSCGFTATLTTGPIVPQWFDIAQPGDAYFLEPKMFIRFQDVVTAFLGSVDVHLDFFFVPLQMIYTPFGSIFTQTNDVMSSQLKNLEGDRFPCLSPESMLEQLDVTAFLTGHEECYGKELMRLYDALDANPLAVINETVMQSSGFDKEDSRVPDIFCYQPYLSPWLFAAYQAIYQKHYRNDVFEEFDIQSYNIDQYYQSTSFFNDRMQYLRYIQRPNDYFTSVRPSAITSSVNQLMSANNDLFPNDGGNFENALLTKVNNFLGDGVTVYSNVNTNTIGNVMGLGTDDIFNNGVKYLGGSAEPSVESSTAANIRATFALDKFLRIYGRAGKTYDEQIKAHFGIDIPHDVKHDITFIKGFKTSLISDPVYSTSTSGNENGSVLGQVGAQVSGNLSGKLKFTAPVHGVIMAVAYAVSKPRYEMTFSKLHLLSERIKFPIPEFDKLGAQPMFRFEYDPKYLNGGGSDSVNAEFLGWQNRYAEFKQKYDRISIAYARQHLDGTDNTNFFTAWVLSRTAFQRQVEDHAMVAGVLSGLDLFELPNALDSVMSVPYDGSFHSEYQTSPHLVFQTDPMLTEFYCNASKVSWMSETGEPDL